MSVLQAQARERERLRSQNPEKKSPAVANSDTVCVKCARNIQMLERAGTPISYCEDPQKGAFPAGVGGWWCDPCLAGQIRIELLLSMDMDAMSRSERLRAFADATSESELAVRVAHYENPFLTKPTSPAAEIKTNG